MNTIPDQTLEYWLKVIDGSRDKLIEQKLQLFLLEKEVDSLKNQLAEQKDRAKAANEEIKRLKNERTAEHN